MVDNLGLTKNELGRYSRHLTLPEIGIEGQLKLKNAKILVIGAGGLGSSILFYLVAAGVGHLGVIDYDVVDDSNLQRQILYTTNDIGKKKVSIAKERLHELNPFVELTTFDEKLNENNVMDIIKDFDFVIDGSDNFTTRYLVNDACVLLKKPLVYGSISSFEGQISVFNWPSQSNASPCYRCLYPEPPPIGFMPNCAEGGVMGVLPGIIGSMQAGEAIKMITSIGTTLSGKLLLYDLLNLEFQLVNIKRKSSCLVCGDNPVITRPSEHQYACGVHENKSDFIKEMSVEKFYELGIQGKPYQLIDVREPHEYAIANLNAKLLPLSQFERIIDTIISDLPSDRPIVVHCKSGARSKKAIEFILEKYKLDNIYNLTGGIVEWVQKFGIK